MPKIKFCCLIALLPAALLPTYAHINRQVLDACQAVQLVFVLEALYSS